MEWACLLHIYYYYYFFLPWRHFCNGVLIVNFWKQDCSIRVLSVLSQQSSQYSTVIEAAYSVCSPHFLFLPKSGRLKQKWPFIAFCCRAHYIKKTVSLFHTKRWDIADLLDCSMEYCLKKKKKGLLCLDTKLINPVWLFHMFKPITTLFDLFHLCWGYRVSLMLPAALFSPNISNRGKKMVLLFSTYIALVLPNKCETGFYNNSIFPNALLIFSKPK